MLNHVKFSHGLARAQRSVALRTIRAYRAVSTDVALVLASILPADLLCLERQRIRDRIEEADRMPRAIRTEERKISIRAWQRRWERSNKGRWTHRLFPNLDKWLSRVSMPLTLHLTQAISSHDCFRSYLHRMNMADDSDYVYCGEEDKMEHTIFLCPHWAEKRECMRPFLNGRLPSPEDIADIAYGPGGWKDQDMHIKDAFINTVDFSKKRGRTRGRMAMMTMCVPSC